MMTDEEYRAEFERVWPWLERAIAVYGETDTVETLWSKIARGECNLWTTPNAAVLSSIEVYSTGMKELRCWLAGGDLAEIQAIEPAIAYYGKENGCSLMAISGRRGWLRALDGYKEACVIMTKGL